MNVWKLGSYFLRTIRYITSFYHAQPTTKKLLKEQQTASLLTCTYTIHCVRKKEPDIIDCNLKDDYQILIIFGTNIPDTTGYQTIV